MARLAAILVALLVLTGMPSVSRASAQPGWLDRAPLNTDTSLVGLHWTGLGRAFRYVAYLFNAGVLAGLIYLLARDGVDFSNYLYVLVAILVGSMLLSYVLSPLIHIFSIIPIFALVTFLLTRFCLVPPKRALLIAVLYQVAQIMFLVICRIIEANLA